MWCCEGAVVHTRHQPVPHRFRYGLWMVLFDADALDHGGRLTYGPLRLRRRDFLDGAPRLRDAVNDRLERNNLPAADRVLVLSQPATWAGAFNPVRFYFAYAADQQGAQPYAVLADINNTPWNERFCYVLDGRDGTGCFRFPKRFHVSPFLPMALEYRWAFQVTEAGVLVHMRLSREGQALFYAGMQLDRQPLTRAALRRAAWRHPLQNGVTLARIYWQALRLKLKRVPFFEHPGTLREINAP